MPDTETYNPAVQQAAERVGGQSELARRLGVRPQSVQYWCKTGYVPLDRVFQIEDLTGVPWQDLRPDLAGMFTGRRRKTDD